MGNESVEKNTQQQSASDSSGINAKDFMIGTLIGGIVGASAALLLAPKSGKQLRSDINEQAHTVMDKTEQLKHTALEKSHQFSDYVTKQSEVIKEKVKHAREEIQDELEDVGEELQEAAEEIKEAFTEEEEVEGDTVAAAEEGFTADDEEKVES